jgi:hypothetical protein
MTPNKSLRFVIPSLFFVAFGCTKASDPVTREVPSALSNSAPAEPKTMVPGYAHTAERSRYVPGGTVTRISDQGYAKVIGSNGVFAVDEINGSAAAVPNASATANPRPPYPGTVQDHHAAALKYFLALDLPADQIGPIQVLTEMRGGHAVTDPRPADTFIGYTSIITRKISGVPVDDSFATVSFDVDGNVVEEHVYWPELPSAILQEVEAFASLQASPSQLVAFRQKLDGVARGYGSGESAVVIHHRRWTERGAAYCKATYDARPVSARREAPRHFNVDGSEEIFIRQYPTVPASLRSL